MPALLVEGLHVSIRGVPILKGVGFAVEPGQTLGVVGESGCGKSLTGLAVVGMLPSGARIDSGRIVLEGRDVTSLAEREWRRIRGRLVSMVVQDPFTALNPVMRVGDQVAEVFRLHEGLGRAEARRRAVRELEKVGVPNPEASARRYPHQLSGGQRQRVVIAIAFASRPRVLVADEPTTALDVTLQAQILRLLGELRRDAGTAVVLVSHDVGVIGSVADKVAVFYAGRIVEAGTAEQVLHRPAHPYTRGLLASLPRLGVRRLESIPGQPPLFGDLPTGCAFGPRCPARSHPCETEPDLIATSDGHRAACWLAEPGRASAPNRERALPGEE